MTARTKLEKYGSVALGMACVFLVFKLVSEIGGRPVEAARSQETVARSSSHPADSPKPLRKEISELARADPNLEVQALKEFETRPFPKNTRDPFDFSAPPPSQIHAAGAGGPGGPGGIGGSTAPAPPQISLQAIGYSLRVGVGGEAYLADSDQVYIVHQGDVVSKQYRILRVTPAMVEVKNEASGQTVQLSIPNPE
jgi:hypothetical protein